MSVLQVKFMVKVAAGYQPKDIITEEANNVGATWIIIDRLVFSNFSCILAK